MEITRTIADELARQIIPEGRAIPHLRGREKRLGMAELVPVLA